MTGLACPSSICQASLSKFGAQETRSFREPTKRTFEEVSRKGRKVRFKTQSKSSSGKSKKNNNMPNRYGSRG